ncbi:AAA family ATPase [Solirubrobacter ginsenosidimutans]|uniref:AAA family ATPase n=1 Tax=Solirubrobacter ginsenosidimutans TaxID=490573 RepID=A0A9X3MPF8_9ACTN|nr:BTAD domain-containing putative transcriptional regulator [Solirubrobacter ginsenosidimutans]MDA0158825.1 AAA family ATPase [Solirubrobacter ginsenosidimutans]
MDIRLLGPVEASLDGRPVALGAPQQRAVLAMLSLQVNRTVSADRLCEGLWGERAPASAPKMVQLYVSQLRKLLRGSVAEIVTRGRGYELRLAVDRVDAVRFERLVHAAEQAGGAPNGEARAALALWRGSPLADVADEPFASAAIRRLEELRLQATELAIDADLGARRHCEVLPELRSLIADEPLRERLRGQYMLALYRSGRQAEALEAYREARQALVHAIGVEPGPELRHLHEAILRQDPRLEPPLLVEATRLAPELDTATPLLGREADLDWLRGHWQRALAGDGRCVLVVGECGIGKTRLVAELAQEVLRDRGAVLYVSARRSADASHALAAARMASRPTLLVLDDVARDLDPLDERFAGAVLVVATAEQVVPSLRAAGTLALAPLNADGARAFARLYAGAKVAVPVERLLVASGGLPRSLHGVASEWARMLELRRLADSVGRINGDRSGLRAAEDDLVGSIVKLQVARERTESRAVEAVCPYKGLASFEAGDADFFFGRERLVAEMVARLTGAPFLGIVGPSGSGKSSVLHAGLLAALAADVIPGSERWTLAVLRPGERPLRALEQALARAPSHGRLVVAVDQFEEAFTICGEESERAAFVDALMASVRDVRRPALVVVAVRADFYGRCAAYTELSRLLGAGHVLVGPMRREELRRAIELPARRAGVPVESELVDALVADVQGQPGALPLVSSALLELWQRRGGGSLRLSDYEKAGGVCGAVARLAEQAYERLDLAGRRLARRVLLRLAGDGEGDAVVRRRARLTEFEGTDVAYVLDVLAEARLISISEGEVEVAHEALLREWPRLRTWLQEDADGRRLHLHLMNAARGWQSADRDPAELYRGARLASTLDWTAKHEPELDGLERAFVAASRAEAEREGERQRRANRRLRVLLAGVGALLALAVAAGAIAVAQRGQARDATVVADAQRVGADAVGREHLDHALLLARAGVELHDSAATRGNLLSVLARNSAVIGVLPGDGWPLSSVVVSPDGRLAAVGGILGAVSVFDVASRRSIGAPYRVADGDVGPLRFSPDGATLAAPITLPSGPVVDLIDPRTRTRRLRIALDPSRYGAASVAFLPDGRDLLIEQILNPPSIEAAVVLRRFDATTGAAEGRALRLPQAAFGLTTTADRRRLVMTSAPRNETVMIDTERLRPLRRWPVGDATGSVSPDGRLFALGSPRGAVRVLDLRSGQVRRFTGGKAAAVSRLAFTPDRRTLVTSHDDGQLLVWDVARAELRERLQGHDRGHIWGLQISADGRTLYSAGEDERALVWDLAGDRRLIRRFDAGPPFLVDPGDRSPRGIAVSPDGRTVAVTQTDGTVDLIDAQTLRPRRSVHALDGFAAAVAFSPDGRLLAIAGRRGQVTLRDARSLQPVGDLSGLSTTSQALAFSPDGSLLAAAEIGTPTDDTAADDGTVRVWDVRRRALTRVRFAVTSASVAFSPDGTLLAAAAREGPTEVRDARTGRLVARLVTPDGGRSLAFSPHGTRLATGHMDGTAQLWSTRSWKPVGPRFEGHGVQRFVSMQFTPDGRVLVTGGADGTVGLHDVSTGNPIGPPLTVEPDTFAAAVLAPDGSRLFAVSDRHGGLRLDISPQTWKRHACLVASRDLTSREWQDALPGQPHRTICRPA